MLSHQAFPGPAYTLLQQGAPLDGGFHPAFPSQQQHGCGVPSHHRPPLPSAPQQQQQPLAQRPGPHSILTHSLQQQAGAMHRPALAPAVAPPHLPPFAAHPAVQQQQQQGPGPLYPGSWQAYAQLVQAQQQQQQHVAAAAFGLPAVGAPPMAPPAGVAPWPTLHPHDSSYQLFHGGTTAEAGAAAALPAEAAAAAGTQQESGRRVRRRRPTARRSLINLFDAAAVAEDTSEMSDDSESDCDMVMMSSQDSIQSAATTAPYPSSGPGVASPGTPYGTATSHSLPSPTAFSTPRMAGEAGSPAGTPPPEARAGHAVGAAVLAPGDHMLPLQHLLMSERAQHLTALEVKAIVYKVAADLAEVHDAGMLHRHVTIASVGLSRSGNLATARLMGHPYNVEAGPRRRYTGGKKAGVDAYLAPELARCPADCVAYTPAGDVWSLGIVLFVLLSGSHVPFGNRGLCWTSIPNMPGIQEPVNKLQRWLEEHLVCKLNVINQLRAGQEKGKAAAGAGPEMRVVGVDAAACDLLLRLLAADPAARPTARQVLRHPWLLEVEGLIPSPPPRHAAYPPSLAAHPSPGFEAKLDSAASDLACLGFSPATPNEEAPGAMGARALLRRSSTLSVSSCDYLHFDPQACPPGCGYAPGPRPGHGMGGGSNCSSAGTSSACLAELPAPYYASHQRPASIPEAAPAPAPAPAPLPRQAPAPQLPVPTHFGQCHANSLLLGDGTSLQLLPPDTAAALAASGLLPDLSASAQTAGFKTLGFAVQPVEVEVEGRRMQLSAIHAVFDVQGQPMLCAQPVAVTQQLSLCATALPAAPSAPAMAPPAHPAAVGCNPDLDTSAPILPLLARMLQQKQ